MAEPDQGSVAGVSEGMFVAAGVGALFFFRGRGGGGVV